MRNWTLALSLLASACATAPVDGTEQRLGNIGPCGYSQPYGNAQHTGNACPEQTGLHVVARLTQDPDAAARVALDGFDAAHYGHVVTSGDYVIVPEISGIDAATGSAANERVAIHAYRWTGGSIVSLWTAAPGWRSVDQQFDGVQYITNGYHQPYSVAIDRDRGSVWAPGPSGRMLRYSLATGTLIGTYDPFIGGAFANDPKLIVNAAPTIDGDGYVAYTATAYPVVARPYGAPTRGAWMVVIPPVGEVKTRAWSEIAGPAVGIETATSLCDYPFFPVSPDAVAPQYGCGEQRPTISGPMAATQHRSFVAGTISNNALIANYLVEIDRTSLLPIRALSTRGHMLYGCGVRFPISYRNCAAMTGNGTAHVGYDPRYNTPVPFMGLDIVASAPVVAPNGDIAWTNYDSGLVRGGGWDARGSGIVWNSNGSFRAFNGQFAWDVTPAVNGSTYLADRNLYSAGDLGVATYAADFSTLLSNGRDGTSQDYRDANIVFGTRGETYAMSNDGKYRKYAPDGTLLESVTLGAPFVAVLQPQSRDDAGRIYVSHAGEIVVLQGGASVTTSPEPPGPRTSSTVTTARPALDPVPPSETK